MEIVTEQRNRVYHVITDILKVLVGKIIHKLEQCTVRKSIKNYYKYWKREEKSNFDKLKNAVMKALIDSSKYNKVKKQGNGTNILNQKRVEARTGISLSQIRMKSVKKNQVRRLKENILRKKVEYSMFNPRMR